MKYLISILIGYLLGSINSAYILGRLKGFDIRTKGSNSAGASNAKITMGWPYFFIVLAFDSCKAILAYFLVSKVLGYGYSLGVIAGCAGVIGHIFPLYLGFKGGKGFASFIGLTLIIDWKFALIIVAIGLVASLITNWIVSCTLVVVVGTPIYLLVLLSAASIIIAVSIVSLVIIYKHFINFKKLRNRKEIGINGCYVGTKIKAEV